MIASDAYWENGTGHPRTTGTYSKVLGRYVRESGSLDADGRDPQDDADAGAAPRGAGAGDEVQRAACASAPTRTSRFSTPRTVIDRSTYREPRCRRSEFNT